MKSLLVDALRQANDSVKSDDIENAVELIETVDEASSESEATLSPELDNLELLQTTDNLNAAENTVEALSELPASTSHVERDGEDTDYSPQSFAAVAVSAGSKEYGVPAPRSVECFAVWTPAVCIMLASCAAAFDLTWNHLLGDVQEEGLRALPSTHYLSENRGAESQRDGVMTRFPLAREETSRAEDAVTPVRRKREASRTAAQTRTNSVPPVIAKSTVSNTKSSTDLLLSLNHPTFTSIDSAYQAYLVDDLSRSGLETFLAEEIGRDATAAAGRLKVLLQRYPDAAALHFALGKLHSKELRWPEARVAFERAQSIDTDNSAYVFNLAVSLEQTGHIREARYFYDSALRLASAGSGEK